MSDNDLPLSPTLRNAMYYNMKHPKRGVALIFNHESYKQSYATLRTGTNIDCAALISCLKELGFEIQTHDNLGHKDIEKQLKAVSEMDHKDHDCLVVTVLTHGDENTLFAYDQRYSTSTIFSYFTADKCPTLAGKPKMFFIQACQGGRLDHGYHLRERTETDGSRAFRIPRHADFLIAHATIPGYHAWRTPSKGSWFIQALCSELSRNGKKVDLLTLLTFVCQRVALEYESYDPKEPDLTDKKQVPYINSMLTRLVKFD